MKLNIKNVYKLFLVGGTILLLNYLLWNLEELWKDFILSLGSGFFSASLLALFVDCINTKNEKAKHKELRKSFLLNISYGILFIAKGVVEKNNQRQMLQTRFYDVFKTTFRK